MARIDIAKRCEPFAGCRIDRFFGSKHDDVRLDAEFLQFFYRVLRRLRFEFLRFFYIGYERQVDVAAVFFADFVFHLTDRFHKRQRFYVADGTADFRNDDVGFRFFRRKHHAAENLFGDVRNDLHRAAVKSAFALFV